MRTPAASDSAARWLKPRLDAWPDAEGGVRVGSIVPDRFEAYARVLHAPAPGLRWADVAAATGRIAHPLMEWHRITSPASGTGRTSWDRVKGEPLEGEPSDQELRALAGVLRPFTDTPQRCWFCAWTGTGGTTESGATVSLPGRDYFLSSGSIDDVAPFEHPPNLWWPDDHAWCVGSEIDLLATYVGGANACIRALLEADLLETVPVSADDRVDAEADLLNID